MKGSVIQDNEEEVIHEVLESMVKSVIDFIGKKISLGIIPYEEVRKITRDPESKGIGIEYERKIDFIALIFGFWEEVLKLQTTRDCISAIENNQIFKEILNATIYIPRFVRTITSIEILKSFLAVYFIDQSELQFDEKKFADTFTIMLSSIRNDFVEIETFIPIERLAMDCDYIELVDGWTIQKVPDERLGELISDLPRFGKRNPELGRIHFALVKTSKEKRTVVKKTRPKQTEAVDSIKPEVIMTALRVSKKGFCSFGDWRVRPINWLFQRRSISLGFRGTNIIPPGPFQGYNLACDEVDSLKELTTLLNNLAQKGELEVSISRFVFGIERQENQDKLIDFMISLESLFLQEKNELTLRLSLRIATFLANNEREHSDIFNLIRTAYSIRGYIVHGEKWDKTSKEISKKGYSLSSLVDGIEDILRVSISKYAELIDRDYTVQRVIDMIDVSIEQDIPYFRN